MRRALALAAVALAACEREPAAEPQTWVAPPVQHSTDRAVADPPPAPSPEASSETLAPAPPPPGVDASVDWRSSSVGFIWHELLSPEPEAAVAFYTEVFGWSQNQASKRSPSAYVRLREGESIFAGVMPLSTYRLAGPARWTCWVGVGLKMPAAEAAGELGAKVLEAHIDHPYGLLALIEDPNGAEIGVLAKRADVSVAPGPVVRHQFLTKTPLAASEFYAEWLGWPAAETASDGSLRLPTAGGELEFVRPGERGLDGVVPIWVPGFAVDDIDEVYERALALGATPVLDFIEMPGERRVLRMRDPQGAPFLVLQRRAGI